jgi:hypothetical protein
MRQKPTQSFNDFWNWLHLHVNCIIRAGTPDAVLYDDEDLHWNLERWSESYVVQLMRGKRILGEFHMFPERISFIEEERIEGDREPEYQFSLMTEYEGQPVGAYIFVMSHSSSEESGAVPGGPVH